MDIARRALIPHRFAWPTGHDPLGLSLSLDGPGSDSLGPIGHKLFVLNPKGSWPSGTTDETGGLVPLSFTLKDTPCPIPCPIEPDGHWQTIRPLDTFPAGLP